MIDISFAKISDYEEIIAFSNIAFSADLPSGGFATVLPKIYSNNPASAKHHILLRAEGKLCALLLCLPGEMNVLGAKLHYCGVGTVGVLPAARGKGYMGKLMQFANAHIAQSGADFAFLGGARHRYERLGYYPAGAFLRANFMLPTLASLAKTQGNHFVLVPLTPQNEHLTLAHSLHNKQALHCMRALPEFLTILQSWQCAPYALLENGNFAGYMAVEETSSQLIVQELSLVNPSNALAAVASLHSLCTSLPVQCALSFSAQAALPLATICDDYYIAYNHSYQINDFAAVLKPLLQLSLTQNALPNGSAHFLVDAQPLSIAIKDDYVSVQNALPAGASPITLSKAEATQLFFGPMGFFSARLGLAAAWFPLHLHMPAPDGC